MKTLKLYKLNSVSILAALFLFMLTGCGDKVNSTPLIPEPIDTNFPFPEFFVEQGSDSDTSYISLRGVQIDKDTLEIQATSWGIIEYGLLLSQYNLPHEINYEMMGMCGTVFTKTWTKVTLKQYLTSTECDTLFRLSFTNFRDTIEVVKVSLHY